MNKLLAAELKPSNLTWNLKYAQNLIPKLDFFAIGMQFYINGLGIVVFCESLLYLKSGLINCPNHVII